MDCRAFTKHGAVLEGDLIGGPGDEGTSGESFEQATLRRREVLEVQIINWFDR